MPGKPYYLLEIKAFWLKVNERYMESTLQSSGARHIDKELFLLQYKDEPYWIDTGNKQQIFSLAEIKMYRAAEYNDIIIISCIQKENILYYLIISI